MRWLLAILTGLCTSLAFALECGLSGPLGLVYPSTSKLKNPVYVSFSIKDNVLLAYFEVYAKRLNVKEKFGPNDYPFQFDVVEVFVSVAGEARYPYYEFNLTPLNQTFQAKIEAPKKFINGVDAGLETRTERTKFGWIGEMRIPLKQLGWDGDSKKLVGNAFAIQGFKPNRSYWSTFLPPQKKPNFHQTQFFKPLCR